MAKASTGFPIHCVECGWRSRRKYNLPQYCPECGSENVVWTIPAKEMKESLTQKMRAKGINLDWNQKVPEAIVFDSVQKWEISKAHDILLECEYNYDEQQGMCIIQLNPASVPDIEAAIKAWRERIKIEECFDNIEKGIKEGDDKDCKKCPLRKKCEEYARSGRLSSS